MSISEKQLEANQRNALRSTGPRTVAGMAISSKNALKHGFRSAEVLIPGEDPTEFTSFRQAMLDDLSPSGQLELMLADRIIGSFWKLRRSGRMENELYISLMDTDYSEDAISQDKPMSFVLGCTNPDGSKYVGSHYSISKTGGVKDLLAEPQTQEPETAKSDSSVRSLGSIALQDFTSGNVLSRFRRYEGQIERSLYKALTELQRLQWFRRKNDMILDDNRP